MVILIGRKYIIVGTKGGCTYQKCKDCYTHGVYVDGIVTKEEIEKEEQFYGEGSRKDRTVRVTPLDEKGNLRTESKCCVCPEDLKLITKTLMDLES